MSNFPIAHKFTAQWEGGLSDHPYDRGGLTAYGASINFVEGIAGTQSGRDFLRQIGVRLPITKDSMRQITSDQAAAMFKREFWSSLRLDDLPLRPAVCLYDMAVNSGPSASVRIAQRGYNRCVMHGVKLNADGILGPLTRKALAQATDAIINAILDARVTFVEDIVRNDESQRVFLEGWLNRINGLRVYVMGL